MINLNIENINIDFQKRIDKDINVNKELFQLNNHFNGLVLKNNFLLCGQDKINYVPYKSAIRHRNLELSELIGDEFLISIKHNALIPQGELTEVLKYQCTHAQVILKSSKGFVFTINNPQGYESGRFGKNNYPFILVRPVITNRVSEEKRKQYYKNIKNWLLLLNSFSYFPRNYNGGDALNGSTVKKIKEFGDLILNRSSNLEMYNTDFEVELMRHPVYCAELIYLALNLGLYYPLNRNCFDYLEEDLYEILEYNENPYIDKFPFSLTDDLKPINEELSFKITNDGLFDEQLAIRPLTNGEILTTFFRESIDPEKLYQLSIDDRKGFINALVKKFNDSDIEFSIYHEQQQHLKDIICKEYGEFENFQLALFRVLNEIEHKMNEKKFIPPHTFLQRIQDNNASNIINFEYVGHALHGNYFK